MAIYYDYPSLCTQYFYQNVTKNYDTHHHFPIGNIISMIIGIILLGLVLVLIIWYVWKWRSAQTVVQQQVKGDNMVEL